MTTPLLTEEEETAALEEGGPVGGRAALGCTRARGAARPTVSFLPDPCLRCAWAWGHPRQSVPRGHACCQGLCGNRTLQTDTGSRSTSSPSTPPWRALVCLSAGTSHKRDHSRLHVSVGLKGPKGRAHMQGRGQRALLGVGVGWGTRRDGGKHGRSSLLPTRPGDPGMGPEVRGKPGEPNWEPLGILRKGVRGS